MFILNSLIYFSQPKNSLNAISHVLEGIVEKAIQTKWRRDDEFNCTFPCCNPAERCRFLFVMGFWEGIMHAQFAEIYPKLNQIQNVYNGGGAKRFCTGSLRCDFVIGGRGQRKSTHRNRCAPFNNGNGEGGGICVWGGQINITKVAV
jgi:hypothetical protein